MSAKPRKSAAKKAALARPTPKRVPADPLLTDLRQMIAEAREQVARTVNFGLTLLYWHIGTRIRRDLLKEKRAEYGKKIVRSVAGQLSPNAEVAGVISWILTTDYTDFTDFRMHQKGLGIIFITSS
jgi:hypothetical protein